MKRQYRLFHAYFHEAFDNFRRGRWMTASSVATMTFALVILGLFFLLSVNLEQMLSVGRSKLLVVAFLEERAGPAEQERLLGALAGMVQRRRLVDPLHLHHPSLP